MVVAAKYPASAYADPSYAAGAAVSDSGAPTGIGICPMLFEQADARARVTPTYAYELDDPNADRLGAFPDGCIVGSEHAAEVQFLDNGYAGVLQPPGIRPDEEAITRSMLNYWASFVADGRSRDVSARWPRYRPGSEQILRFQPDGNVVVPRDVAAEEHNCDFWKNLAD